MGAAVTPADEQEQDRDVFGQRAQDEASRRRSGSPAQVEPDREQQPEDDDGIKGPKSEDERYREQGIDPGQLGCPRRAVETFGQGAQQQQIAQVGGGHDRCHHQGVAGVTDASAPEAIDRYGEEGPEGREFAPPVAKGQPALIGELGELIVIQLIAHAADAALCASDEGRFGHQEENRAQTHEEQNEQAGVAQ